MNLINFVKFLFLFKFMFNINNDDNDMMMNDGIIFDAFMEHILEIKMYTFSKSTFWRVFHE